jgi:hypothetical protein
MTTTAHRVEDDKRQKVFETARAELALHAGIAVHELTDGTFLLSRWNLTRHCASLEEVLAFARQAEVR